MKIISIESSFFQFQRYSGDEIDLDDEATIVWFGKQSNATANILLVRMKDAVHENFEFLFRS